MKEKECLPNAYKLIESMRYMGYSFESAIADLIDNSITAMATKINIYMIPYDDPYIIIHDDGCGMDDEKLSEAMRMGSNPNDVRDENDLGRFGLGLKTASLSLCRKLIVASKKNNKLSCYSWDLDYVKEKNKWLTIQYSEEEINKMPMYNELMNNIENGTYILLKNFDRIKSTTNDFEKTFNEKIDDTRNHIALVFHRFIQEGLNIYINNDKIEGRDPFLENNKATQPKRTEEIKIEDETITVKPYILPHINKLTKEDIEKVGGKEDLKKNQGFYIYRNKRLIIWGTWFRYVRQEELSKLARIKVDIPNTLDKIWKIDIKKSTASIPDSIKKNLVKSIEDSILSSKNVYRYRGRRKSNSEIIYTWDKIKNRDEVMYKINRELPQYKLLFNSLDNNQKKSLELLLREIELNLPIDAIYTEKAEGNKIQETEENFENMIKEFMESQEEECKKNGINYEEFIEKFRKTELYKKINKGE